MCVRVCAYVYKLNPMCKAGETMGGERRTSSFETGGECVIVCDIHIYIYTRVCDCVIVLLCVCVCVCCECV